jgi:FkbM family methyltransferase
VFGRLRRWLAGDIGPSSVDAADLPSPVAEDAAPSPVTIRDDLERGSIPVSLPVTAMAYDENLLERARVQWRRGDWESLIGLDMNAIEHHPDRAKLGLVIASAWLQCGDEATARHYLRHALDWGCDKRLAARILVAGVHNSLACTAAIIHDDTRMDYHFRGAVAGSGIQTNRGAPGRRHAELHRLSLHQAGWGSDNTSHLPLGPEYQPISYPPHGITSYAQNFEDVMLWRALWDVENGYYIDVGAWDPVVDSVSKAFYEHGWRGIHVEPLPEFAEKIQQDRPDEKLFQFLLDSEPGEKTFYCVLGTGTGMSTASKVFAERHHQAGWTFEERRYPTMTLAQVFDEAKVREIHWLKIDVEGSEDAALAGWGQHPARPWIVLLEAIEPNTTSQIAAPTWKKWQPLLEERGYRFVYFDGLNRFYVHKIHEYLAALLQTPPNVFDHFIKCR